jgi:Site-specific recombinase XerD
MSTKTTLNRIEGKIDKLLEYNEASKYVEEVLMFTLADWLVEWLDLFKRGKVKPSTLYHQELAIKNYIADDIGKRPLQDVDGAALQRFLMKIKAPRQREHVYGVLRDAFNRAYALKMIDYNPIAAVSLPARKKRKARAFDKAQEREFVSACKSHMYGAMFLIMLYAGLRRGEVMALNYSDIDLNARKIYVTKTVNDFGKIGTPKTDASVREVPVFDNLFPYLGAVLKRSDARRIWPFSETITNNAFWDILRASGLYGQGFTTHSLRHTFVTRCIEDGVPVKVVQKWVGHSTSVMTMNVYAHVNNDFETKAIKDYNSKLGDES